MKSLKHENIVRYLGTEYRGNSFFIKMEYIPGGSIADLLRKYGRFKEPAIRSFTGQILRGLAYLHSHGIVHRGRWPPL